MADSALLTIETDFISVEFRGPHRSGRKEALGLTAKIESRLVVDAGIAPARVTYVNVDGRTTSWLKDLAGPQFHESTAYQLVAISRSGSVAPVVTHRDRGLVRDLTNISGQPITVGPINFSEHVGLSDFSFSVGDRMLRVTLEVFPTKLDYAEDFRDLLREVNSAARGLAFEYLRSTYLNVGAEHAETSTGLEWLSLLKHHIATLELAMLFADSHPRRALRRGYDTVRIERVRRADNVVRAALRKRSAKAVVSLEHVGYVPQRVLAGRALETLDTNEHRWLKQNLILARDRLASIAEGLRVDVVAADLAKRSATRLKSEFAEVVDFRDRVSRLIELPVLAEALPQFEPTFSSLTLMMAPGYAEAYQSLLALRLGLTVEGGALAASPKELDVLYENWCFIRLAQIIAACCGAAVELDDVLAVNASGIRVRLTQGRQSSICLKDAKREIRLTYNRHFDGLTGSQRPDVVLELLHLGWPEIIIVFDAKYRVDASDEYIKTFAMPGPPVDAVNALHRYRDAIVLGAIDSPRGRPVVKGVALFPLTAGMVGGFSAHPFFRSLDVLHGGCHVPVLDEKALLAANEETHQL
jgi:hypothetical protein